jgi:hypothetical protein
MEISLESQLTSQQPLLVWQSTHAQSNFVLVFFIPFILMFLNILQCDKNSDDAKRYSKFVRRRRKGVLTKP